MFVLLLLPCSGRCRPLACTRRCGSRVCCSGRVHAVYPLRAARQLLLLRKQHDRPQVLLVRSHESPAVRQPEPGLVALQLLLHGWVEARWRMCVMDSVEGVRPQQPRMRAAAYGPGTHES
jgi:hypothetical protein